MSEFQSFARPCRPANPLCGCGSGLGRRQLVDARGIFCVYLCDRCETAQRTKFRAEIFCDPNYWTDEPAEEDGFR